MKTAYLIIGSSKLPLIGLICFPGKSEGVYTVLYKGKTLHIQSTNKQCLIKMPREILVRYKPKK